MTAIAEFQALSYHIGPGVLLISEADPGAARAGAILAEVVAAGGESRNRIGLAAAAERIARGDPLEAVIVDLEEMAAPLDVAGEEALDALLVGLDREAARQHAAILILTPLKWIDRVFALARHPTIAILAAADAEERRAEIKALLTPLEQRLGEGGDSASIRLLQLREEVARIARSLARLSAAEPPQPAEPEPEPHQTDGDPPLDAAAVRLIIRARRLRDQFFTPALFADPAWDMLLDLMAARLEGQPVAVSSLCIAAAVPPTTALRWIRTLEDARLLRREADASDRRRVFIRLAETAAGALSRYFCAARRIGAIAV